jgi:hypothetical protein
MYGDQAVTICEEISYLLANSFDWMPPDALPVHPDSLNQQDPRQIWDYLVEYSLSDLEGRFRCSIMPGSYEAEWLSRKFRQEIYGIDIVLLCKCATQDDRNYAMETMDTLIRLLEDNDLAGSPAKWIGVERPTLFNSDRLQEENVFATGSRHNYLIVRDRGIAS